MPAQLLALSDGPTLLLDKPILLVGRQAECDIQLNSRKVSRRHCIIAQIEDYLVVRDLGSTNGIRINGQRVIEGTLKAGDELTVGNFRYQVALDPHSGTKFPAISPASASGPSDVSLEGADKPIPLDERDARGRILAARPVPKVTADESSFVLPDRLRGEKPAR